MLIFTVVLALGRAGQHDDPMLVFDVGSVRVVVILAFLLLPWSIPVGALLAWVKSHRRPESHSFGSRQLCDVPVIADDLKAATECIGDAALELRWDTSEVTASYERIGHRSWAIVVNPELWAAAKSGDLLPLRFAIHHEASHIRDVAALSKWQHVSKWICPPAHASARIMGLSAFQEELHADSCAAEHLGGREAVVQVLRRFGGRQVAKPRRCSVRDIWRDLLRVFVSDAVFFTPHPKLRIWYLGTSE